MTLVSVIVAINKVELISFSHGAYIFGIIHIWAHQKTSLIMFTTGHIFITMNNDGFCLAIIKLETIHEVFL